MASTREETSELLDIEEHALEHLEEDRLIEPEDGVAEPDETEPPVPVGRLGLVIAFSVMAAAVMVGGVFQGIGARPWAAVAGILGIVLATRVHGLKNPIFMNLLIVAGIFAIGVILTVPAGSFDDVINLGPFVRDAVTSGDVQRPPVPFDLGWRAIVGWLMGGLGFAATWIAIQLRKPSLGLLSTLPVIAITAISVSDDTKILSGLMSMVFFAIGLGVLSGVEMGEGEQRSLTYELRRAIRAVPLLAIITVALYFMAVNNFLFPQPRFDPTQEAQRPRTVPLSEVPDRVLFTVQSSITGPWKMGVLDVYNDNQWLLPPFAENQIRPVPSSGIVDAELQAGVSATIETVNMEGAVLPGLPNMVAMVAEGPRLAFDRRTGNIRLSEGSIQAGLRYAVTAARVPLVEEIEAAEGNVPENIQRFLEMPPPPQQVSALLAQAPPNKWQRLDFLRQTFLQNAVASGSGTPVAVPPERVGQIVATTTEATPYEIVAAQAMLARWAGIPARIGYGFDGGEPAGEVLEVRPKHGASWLEVYFPGYKWVPIIGTPLLAQSSVGGEQTQESDSVLASDDIAVKVFIPVQTDPSRYLFEQLRRVIFIVAPILLLLLLAYYSYPFLRKARLRSKRRSWAQSAGPYERIAVAYADWRDLATDFGYRYGTDTPLMFLDRVVEDDEHTEFAWLVTRCLWGDLKPNLGDADATAAEELSKALMKRMSQAHAWTLRLIAAVSRLSIRNPYAPTLGLDRKEAGKDVKEEALAA